MVCKRIFLSGKVQGVGFRYHTLERTKTLNLKGFVRNLSDGRVEILACGELENLEALIAWAKKGPTHSRVDSIEIIDVTHDFPEEPFYIK